MSKGRESNATITSLDAVRVQLVTAVLVTEAVIFFFFFTFNL